jgi:hypothetical protein
MMTTKIGYHVRSDDAKVYRLFDTREEAEAFVRHPSMQNHPSKITKWELHEMRAN